MQAITTKRNKKNYVRATLSQFKIGSKNHIREHNHKIKLLVRYVFVKCTKLCSAVAFMAVSVKWVGIGRHYTFCMKFCW